MAGFAETLAGRLELTERRLERVEDAIGARFEKIEDRMLEITKWQYKAIGLLAGLALARDLIPLLLRAARG